LNLGEKARQALETGDLSHERRPSVLLRTCLVLGLAYCIYLVARQAIGAWYFQKSLPDAVQSAIKWDPGNPEYYDALATLTHLYAENASPASIVRLCETATRLSPYNAEYWADLGSAYEWAGRRNDALRAFTRAREFFPNSPDINWRLANFYVRSGKTSDALEALRKVLLVNSMPERQIFTLASNATRDNSEIIKILPPRTFVWFDYLNFEIEAGRINAAEDTWSRLLASKLPFELPQSFPYLNALIQHHEPDKLVEAWSTLGQRFPSQIHAPTPAANLVTNGNFESEILNGGLGWRIIPVEGAAVGLDSQNALNGSRSLQIDFDGAHNLAYSHVLQYVPVAPNTRYRLSAWVRTQDITTDSGPRWEVFDEYDMAKVFVAGQNMVGTTDWTEQKLDFTAGADTRLVIIRVARPASHKLGNQIGGTAWVARVSLTRLNENIPKNSP
jgi:hypothetical protein